MLEFSGGGSETVSEPIVTVVGMTRTIKDLQATPDETLIAEHDQRATNTVAGTAYYLEELDRRSRERSTKASNRLAVESHRLATESQLLASKTQRLAVASTGVCCTDR